MAFYFETEYGIPKSFFENVRTDHAAICIRSLTNTNSDIMNETVELY